MSDPRQFDPSRQHLSAQRGPDGYAYPTLPPGQKPPKRRHRIRRVLLWLAAGFLALGIIATAVSGGNGGSSAAHPTSSPAATEAVTETAVPSPSVVVTTPSATEAVTPTPTPPAAPQVLLDLAGNGINNTKEFVAGAPWTLKYSFDCSGFGPGQGNFIVTIAGSDGLPVAIPVNALDASGQSESQVYNTGTLHLEINSECDWHVTAVG